ncbi:MAG: matrixin family metalloprotease [Chloroflexota bacterium]
MSTPPPTVLPVVAHRILGAESDITPPISERVPAYEEDRRWLAWSSRGSASSVRRPPVKSAARVASPAAEARRLSPGTRRTIEQIRDLFDGGGRGEGTYPSNVNRIWAPAGVELRLVAVVDHAIKWTLSWAVDSALISGIARELNTPHVVNLYCFRTILGATGVGGFSPVPLDSTRHNVPFAAIEDWEETATGEAGWNSAVRTAAHELGHLLRLRHHESSANLMYPWATESAHNLEPTQVMLAHEHALKYAPERERLRRLEIAVRQRLDDRASEPLHKRAYLGERPWPAAARGVT